jgi:hypothetical protein
MSARVSQRDNIDKSVMAYSGAVQNVDAEKRAREEIEADARRLKKLLEKAPIAIFEGSLYCFVNKQISLI